MGALVLLRQEGGIVLKAVIPATADGEHRAALRGPFRSSGGRAERVKSPTRNPALVVGCDGQELWPAREAGVKIGAARHQH